MGREKWKPCPHFSLYVVSSTGRVRRIGTSLPLTRTDQYGNIITYTRKVKSRVLSLFVNRNGYHSVTLFDGTGVRSVHRVHRLVCEACY